ncbi:MAG: hypothetical protein ABIH83_02085 [Candidatus Micrarchaeota archaeon]
MIILDNARPTQRRISLSLYLAALFISTIIFISGIYIGKMIEQASITGLSSGIDEVSADINSIELLYLLEEDSPAFCPVYRDELSKLDIRTEELGSKISYLEEKRGVEDVELKKKYFMLEANTFLLSQKVRGTCGANYSTILYFYSNKQCDDCAQQGEELSQLKKKLGENVRIYSFDGELGSAIVDALMMKYEVNSFPSIVINSNYTASGFKTQSWVEKNID